MEIIKNVFGKFVYFTLWVVIVNFVWFFVDGFDTSYLISSSFVIYNLLFCILNISIYLYDKEKFVKYFQLAVILNIGINFIVYLMGLGRMLSDNRQILFFNDPNQMGYYFFMVIMLSYAMNLKYRHFIGIASTFFVFISASRGVTISVLLFYALLLFNQIYLRGELISYLKKALIAALVFIAITSFYDLSDTTLYNQVNYIESRFQEDSTDDHIVNRGWDRLADYWEHTIFGYGEGGIESGEKYQRSIKPTDETHSTWANFIMSYGLIGFTLFLLIFFQCVVFEDFMYYVPFWIHGIIQVDSRQTTFWLILFILFVVKRENKSITWYKRRKC